MFSVVLPDKLVGIFLFSPRFANAKKRGISMKSKSNLLLKIALTGVLAAVAAILYMFPTFPILPLFPWLEIDFADVPALFVSVLINPIYGGIVVFIRNLVHIPPSSTGMVGELSNFIISSLFVMSAGFFARIFRKNKDLSLVRLIIVMLIGMLVQVVAATLCNRYIMIPLYGIKGSALQYILLGVVPFNLIKTAISSTVFIVLFKLLLPKIKRYL